MESHADRIILPEVGEWTLDHGETRVYFCSYESGFEGAVDGYHAEMNGTRDVWHDPLGRFVLFVPHRSENVYLFDGESGQISLAAKLPGRIERAAFVEWTMVSEGGVLLTYETGVLRFDRAGRLKWTREADLTNYGVASVSQDKVCLRWRWANEEDHPSRVIRLSDGADDFADGMARG